MVGCHLLLASVAYLAAFALGNDLAIPGAAYERWLATLPILLLVRLALSHRFGLDRSYWKYVGLNDLLLLTASVTLGSVVFPGVLFVLGELHGIPPAVFLLDWLLAIALTAGARAAVRLAHERSPRGRGRGERAFILGAGEAGEQLLRQLQHGAGGRYEVVGLIDDDPAKHGRSLHRVPVLGGADHLRGLAALHHARVALIAIPSARADVLRRLVDRCTDAGMDVKLLPPLQDLVSGDVNVSQIREVRIEDLLGREPVRLDVAAVGPDLAGKTVVVTGAAGSIGAELARQIVRYHPLALVLIDRAESPLYFTHLEVSQANPAVRVVPVLASVTNAERLGRIFARHPPDCVFHAAAYKHVPLLEANVLEGVWNNVVGTLCVARAAARAGAQKFVLISTDKAVNPTSVLGVTKLIAERIVLELPSLRAATTDFRVVRFGNVLNSDGSVLPLFRRQLAAGGPLTITHPEMRRYFMTIPEAVQLILQATTLPEAAGRIALLEMGTQVRILDLAEQLIRLAGLLPYKDVDIAFTGLRPGEKLQEELLASDERAVATSVGKIRLVERPAASTDGLARRLRRLVRAAAGGDAAVLRREMASLAPTYRPALPEPMPYVSHVGHAAGNGNGNGNGHGGRRRVSGGSLTLILPALPRPRASGDAA